MLSIELYDFSRCICLSWLFCSFKLATCFIVAYRKRFFDAPKGSQVESRIPTMHWLLTSQFALCSDCAPKWVLLIEREVLTERIKKIQFNSFQGIWKPVQKLIRIRCISWRIRFIYFCETASNLTGTIPNTFSLISEGCGVCECFSDPEWSRWPAVTRVANRIEFDSYTLYPKYANCIHCL